MLFNYSWLILFNFIDCFSDTWPTVILSYFIVIDYFCDPWLTYITLYWLCLLWPTAFVIFDLRCHLDLLIKSWLLWVFFLSFCDPWLALWSLTMWSLTVFILECSLNPMTYFVVLKWLCDPWLSFDPWHTVWSLIFCDPWIFCYPLLDFFNSWLCDQWLCDLDLH